MKQIFKLFILLAVLNVGFGAATGKKDASPRDESVDNYITMVLENFAIVMREGDPALGIPILDPFYIDHLELYGVDTGHLVFDANASSIMIQDLSYYTPTYVHAEFNTFTLYITLDLPRMFTNGTYWCNGMFKHVFPIFGDGWFTLTALNITAGGVGSIYITEDNYLQIAYLNMTIVFEELVVYLDNFLGGGDFGDQVNEMISQIGKLLFDAMMPWVSNTIIPILVDYLNLVLMQHTIYEIIEGALPTFPPVKDLPPDNLYIKQ